MPPKRQVQYTAEYLLAERTARKQKKAAWMQEQAQAQAQVLAEQVALQALYDQLQADHDLLTKKTKNKKKAVKRKLRRAEAALTGPTGPTVVHGSNSCEEDDEDVMSKHDFLSETLPGTSEKLDEELAIHIFAQQALKSGISSASSHHVTAPSEEQAVNGPAAVAPSTPPAAQNATASQEAVENQQATRAACSPAVDLLLAATARPHSLSYLFDEDYEAASSLARDESDADLVDTGDGLIDQYLERKTLEEQVKANMAMHDERVIRLVNSGYNLREAIDALAATKAGGLESTSKAVEHLRVKSGTAMSAISRAVVDCNQKIDKLTCTAESKVTAFGPSLSEFVSNNAKAEDLAGRAQLQHDKSAFGHLACPSRAAINLKEIIRRGNDAQLRDSKWLGAICLAVCEDCSKCAANKAKKQEREDADRAKLLSSAEKAENVPGQATEPWSRADAKHDRKLPRLLCFICGDKSPESRNQDPWVYHCDRCRHAAHEGCERLTEWVENSGSSSFLCKRCLRDKQSALDSDRRGPTRDWTDARYIGGGGPAGSGLASPHRHPPAANAAGAAPRRSHATPPGSPSEFTAGSPRSSQWDNRQEIASLLQKLVDNSSHSGTKDSSALNASTSSQAATGTNNTTSTSTGASNTNVKINNYIMWEETSAGKPKQGTETGSGVAAWAWFKRTNIPIRDAAVNMKGGLGLLAANAISHNMQITLAASMLNEAEVQPEQNMTEKEIDLWVKSDREFTWFKTLPDSVLIKVMDRLSASVNPAPFFRLVIAAEIPTMKDGDLYYPVTEFNSHADKWISTLSDLIKGGWQEGSTNLKQVFLASICTCQLVYDQAKREMHEDVLRLIATLKKWIVVQDNEIQSAKAAKASIKNKTKAQEAVNTSDTDKAFEKRVRALFTSMNGTTQPSDTIKTQAAQPGPMWQCQSCGNEWRDDPARPPRCKKECVYSEHKDFNKLSKYPKGSKPLTWKGYGEPYPPKQQAFFDKRDTAKGSSGQKYEGRKK
jgi:hypothetical protein